MGLLDAVVEAGLVPPNDVDRSQKKRYSELLSRHLAREVAAGLRAVGFPNVKPLPGGPGERAFQGGLGPKKVDVAFSDEQHGLLLAVSIKTISFPPFGKNLKNRFADLCTEAITLHLRFPYSVVCALFAFPMDASRDVTPGRAVSTSERAKALFATIRGRSDYTDLGEKFEHVAVMLYDAPPRGGSKGRLTLFDVRSNQELTEQQYFLQLRNIYNLRNPHATIGEEAEDDEQEEDTDDEV